MPGCRDTTWRVMYGPWASWEWKMAHPGDNFTVDFTKLWPQMLRTSLRSSQVRCIKHKPLIVVFKFAWHTGIEFSLILTTINFTPPWPRGRKIRSKRPHACLKLGFAALKFVGGIVGNHLSNPRGPPIPGPRAHIWKANCRPPWTVYRANCRGCPGGGGGDGYSRNWLMHYIHVVCSTCAISWWLASEIIFCIAAEQAFFFTRRFRFNSRDTKTRCIDFRLNGLAPRACTSLGW